MKSDVALIVKTSICGTFLLIMVGTLSGCEKFPKGSKLQSEATAACSQALSAADSYGDN